MCLWRKLSKGEKMAKLQVAALQLPTLGMNATRLEFYIKNAKDRDAKLVLLGEYVLNHFFLELAKMPKKMVKEQTKEHIELLEEFAKRYNMIFIAPIVRLKDKKYLKSIVKISPDGREFYNQQILINYPHWNEEEFFSNRIKRIKKPMSFEVDGVRVAVLAGFELHFDKFWRYIDRESIDLVLAPTASTFDSSKRWQEIIKVRAFLHSCYILRANRVGEYLDNGINWLFYGDSMLTNPNGTMEMILEDKESMLVESVDSEITREHRELWGFQEALRVRGEI
jgi:predicted amidohydrolase